VILSSVEWGAAWQRHHSFAARWAKSGRRVFFVENTGFREPGLRDIGRVAGRLGRALAAVAGDPRRVSGVRVISPLVLPPTRRVFREINASLLVPRVVDLMRDRGLGRSPIVFAYLPTATTLAFLDALRPSIVVYDCVDNFYGLAQPPMGLAESEKALLARSALVLTTSRTLRDAQRAKHSRVIELHHGVGSSFFLPNRPRDSFRRFCYFGTLWRAVDYAPIAALAEAGFEVELIGPVKEPLPPLPSNVRRRGPVAHDELPLLLEEMDALILPYVEDEYNKGVIPAKTYECLATGLPVLASPLPALTALPELSVLRYCRSPSDWVATARALSAQEADGEKRRERVRVANAHQEEAVFERLLALLEDARAAGTPPVHARTPRAAMASGLIWIGALFGAAKTLTLGVQVLAGRLLGPDEFGRAGVVLAAAAYLQIIPMLGFPTALGKLISDEHDETRRARLISTALASFAVWAAAAIPLMLAAHRAFEALLGLTPGTFAWAAVLAVMTALFTTLASPLLGLKRFAHRGLAEAVYAAGAAGGLAAALALWGPDRRTLIAAFCGGLGLGSIYALWALRAYLGFSFEKVFVREVSRFAAVATLNMLAAACVMAPGRFALHARVGTWEAGVFSAYFTATLQIALALQLMLTAVLLPIAGDRRGQQEAWNFLRRHGAASFAAALAAFAVASSAAMTLFGRNYPMLPGWTAAFALAAAMCLLHGACSALFAARGFDGLKISVTGGLLAGLGNTVLAALLAPWWGVTGAALALCGGYALGLAWYAIQAPREARA
jgi:O-antigen/teichoic acid export membrane protein/glycosyltransferase involved in cell wall biosynthesis